MSGGKRHKQYSWEKAVISHYTPQVLVVDNDFVIQFVSDRNTQIFSRCYTPSFSDKLKDYISDTLFNRLQTQLYALKSSESDSITQLHVYSFNGNDLIINVKIEKIKNPDEEGQFFILNISNQIYNDESIYHATFENVNDGLILYNRSLQKIVDVNDQLLNMLGYEKLDLQNLKINEFFPFEQESGENSWELIKSFRNKLDVNNSVEKELILKRKDGSHFYTDVKLTKLKAPNDSFTLTVIKDISDRKKVKRKIKKRFAHLKNIFQKSNVGFIVLEVDNERVKIKDCNDSIIALLRLASKEELLNSELDHFISNKLLKEGKIVSLSEYILKKTIVDELDEFTTEWKFRRSDRSLMYGSLKVFRKKDGEEPNQFILEIQDITELKNSLSALSRSEQQFTNMFKNSPSGTLLLRLNPDNSTTIFDCNDALLEMFRCNKEQFLHHTAHEVFPEYQIDGANSVKKYNSLLTSIYSNKSVKVEWQHLRYDGSLMYNIITIFPLSSAKEEQLYILDFRDVTEKFEAQLALKKSEEQFRNMFELSAFGILLIKLEDSGERTIVDCNQALLDMFRCTKEQFLNHADEDLFPEFQSDGRRSIDYFDDMIRGVYINKVSNVQWEHNRFDGTRMYNFVTVFPLERTDENRYFVINFQDVTEERTTRLELERSENQFREIFSESNFGMLLIEMSERSSRIVDFNDAIVEMFRCEREDFLRLNNEMTMFPEFQLDGRNSMEAYRDQIFKIKNGFSKTFNWLHKRFDGSLMYNLMNVYPIRDKNDKEHYIVSFQDITEKHEAQIALKSSESQFRSLFEQSPIGIILVKVLENGRMIPIECNDALIEIFRCEKNEFFSRPFQETFPKFQEDGSDSYEKFKIIKKEAFNSDTYLIEWQLYRFDGTIMYSQISSYLMNEIDGVKYYAINFQDITEKHKAQKDLKLQNLELRAVIDSLPMRFYHKDLNNNILRVNKAAAKQFKTSTSSMEGKNAAEFFPIDAVRFHNYDNQVFRSGESIKDLISFSDGKWTSTDVIPFKNEKEETTGVLVFATDITNKHNTQLALKKSEELYKSLFANSLIGLMLENSDSIVIDINDALCNMWGYDREELIGNTQIMELLTKKEDIEHSRNIMNELKRGEIKGFTIRKSYIKKDGSEMKAIAFVRGNFNHSGTLENILVAILDITKLHKTEKELEVKLTELSIKNMELEKYIASNLELENFAYIASHDLKEPVRSIKSFAQLLDKNYRNIIDNEGQEYLDFVISAAGKMNLLIEDLLTFSRVHSQKALVRSKVYTEKVIYIVSKNLNEQVKKSNAEIKVFNLPETIYANELKMTQILQNLISNALKFVPEERTPVVEISAEDIGSHWKFYVKDNGVGISEEYQEKIFVLFKRLHTKEEFEGTGLGLAICKKIVRQHGGSIWVESEEREGATFYFTISKE